MQISNCIQLKVNKTAKDTGKQVGDKVVEKLKVGLCDKIAF